MPFDVCTYDVDVVMVVLRENVLRFGRQVDYFFPRKDVRETFLGHIPEIAFTPDYERTLPIKGIAGKQQGTL